MAKEGKLLARVDSEGNKHYFPTATAQEVRESLRQRYSLKELVDNTPQEYLTPVWDDVMPLGEEEW